MHLDVIATLLQADYYYARIFYGGVDKGWRRDSVVRTSVFGWRTLPDLWLTCDHFVGKVSAMGQPTRPTQPSVPSGSVSE